MKKVFEITLQTSIDKPSRNIFRRLWRAFRELNGVVSIPFPESCPDPWRTLTMLHCVSSAGSRLAHELLSRLCSPDYTESTRPLPPKAGSGFVSVLLQKSAKGVTVSAKILTRSEGRVVRLSIYSNYLDTPLC